MTLLMHMCCRYRFPLYISQDSNNAQVMQLAQSYAPTVRYMQHRELQKPQTHSSREPIAYYRIANHYKFIFMQMFDCFQYPKAIILEVNGACLASPGSLHAINALVCS